MRIEIAAERLLLTVAVASGLVAACLAYTRSRGGPPVGVVLTPSQRIVSGPGTPRPVVATYRIANRGGRTLVLGQPTTTCGCTGASIRPERLEPGREAVVTVQGDPPSVGETTVRVAIPTNAPPPGELTLELTMVGTKPVPYVNSSSGPIRFGVVRADGASESITVDTREPEGREPWIRGATGHLSGLEVRGGLKEEFALKGGVVVRHYSYTALLTKRPAPGDFTGEVTFQGRGPDPAPVLRLPVLGTVRPPVYAIPPSLFADFEPGREAPALGLVLESDDRAFPLRAEPEAVAGGKFEIRRHSRQGGRIGFEVKGGADLKESFATTLILRTNHPSVPGVRVPLAFHRSRGG